jgi:hypothetical protein
MPMVSYSVPDEFAVACQCNLELTITRPDTKVAFLQLFKSPPHQRTSMDSKPTK